MQLARYAGPEPRSLAQALKGPDAAKWLKAAEEEMNALYENQTWDLVPLPPGKKAIGSGWVFRIKHLSDGEVERYKGRVVAKGFSQRYGYDYIEVFAPTFHQASICLILAIAAVENLHLRSADISSAFLNGDLEEEVYMKQPEGLHQLGPEYVCKLNKALYGLKQSP